MVDLPRSALKNKKRIKFQQMSATTTNKLVIAAWRKHQSNNATAMGLQVKEVKKAANSSGLSKALKQSLYLSQFGLAYPKLHSLGCINCDFSGKSVVVLDGLLRWKDKKKRRRESKPRPLEGFTAVLQSWPRKL